MLRFLNGPAIFVLEWRLINEKFISKIKKK